MRGRVSVVQGEVAQLLSAVRKTGRWSGHGRTEGEQDPLVRSLHKLQVTLNSTPDLRTLDVMVFLHPFCEIIQSDDTTGPITGMAIASLDRFLSYGLIDPTHPTAAEGVASLSEAVTHARFVGTNPASDEVVLMKILQILHTLMLTPVGRLLSNESVCEIMQSCFRICFELRLSELLRNYAETTLVDMVQLLFIQLHSFSEDQYTVDDTASIIDQTIMAGGEGGRGSLEPSTSIDDEEEVHGEVSKGGEEEGEVGARSKEEVDDSNGGDEGDEHDQLQQQDEADEPGVKVESQPAEFVSGDVFSAVSRHKQSTLVPYGLPCVRELLRFLVSLINMRERANSESLLHIGLNLITVALESGGDSICSFPSLAQLVRDALSRNLFTLLRHSNFSVFSATLRAICLLLQHCRVSLRFQVEWGLNAIMDLFSIESGRIPYDRKEAVLEMIVQLCHYPYLVAELYVNYDCSLYCSNVFEKLTKLLSKNAIPTQGLASSHLLSLDALLAIVKNFHTWQTVGEDTAITPSRSHSLEYSIQQGRLQDMEKSSPAVVSREGSTRINSAGIIFSSRTETEKYLVEKMSSPTITSVRSESILVGHDRAGVSHDGKLEGGGEGVALPMDEQGGLVKAASGYMMATSSMGDGYDDEAGVTTVDLPTPKELIEIRQRKKVILVATEQFNNKPKQGVTFLQERGIISDSSSPSFAEEIASFLVDNPRLNKAMIGEYVGDRKYPAVLDAFVKRFSLHGSHLVDALRHFLESFRLPGESPIIARILETFSEHWLSCNKDEQGKVFANRDAVYVLCYAILMLNTDQYSAQVKKRMSLEEFIHNQRKINDGQDFPREFLTDIFNRIREEEIIMPDEHVGAVKENYQWKVLLHRSGMPDSAYRPVNVSSFNQDLFILCCNQTVSALSYVFENTEEKAIVQKAIGGFSMCASVAAHYNLSQVCDKLVISLCKFTTLLNPPETPSAIVMTLGTSSKVRQCLLTMFSLAHQHGNILRDSWKNILDALVALFKCKLLPQELVQVRDFVHSSGTVSLYREETPSTRSDSSLLSHLSFWLLNDSQSGSNKPTTPSEIRARKIATKCVKECRPQQLVSESKFLQPHALLELIKTLMFASRGPEDHLALGTAFHEESAVFFLELFISVAMDNKDRVALFFNDLITHLERIIQTSQKHSFFLERCVVGLLRLVTRMMSRETMVSELLGSLGVLLTLPSPVNEPYLLTTHQQITRAIADLIQSQAAAVKTQRDWQMLGYLLESIGTGSSQLSGTATWSPFTSSVTEHPVTSDPQKVDSPPTGTTLAKSSNVLFIEALCKFDILVEECIKPHEPDIFFQCCKMMSDLVRSDVHVTAANFSTCVHCIRTFSEVSSCKFALEHDASMGRLHPFVGSSRHPSRSLSPTRGSMKSGSEGGGEKENQSYTTYSLQLLDLMDTLFARIVRVFTRDAITQLEMETKTESSLGTKETGAQPQNSKLKACPGGCEVLWQLGWCPLLQGMARMCCDTRKSVRQTAITYLQRALLAHELQNLTSKEWESCFLKVFFPMLSRLLEVSPTVDHFNLEETRVRASNLLCKVFLQHLLSLSSLPHFADLWFGILDFMEKYLCLENSDLLTEAIPESIKNLLLVMSTQGVLEVTVNSQNKNEVSLNLLEKTWLRIEQFLPGFMKQLFPSVSPPTTQAPPLPSSAPQESPATLAPSLSHPPTKPSQSYPPQEYPLEGVVGIQEIPVTMTMDHVTGGVTMAATPIQAPCNPSRSPPGTSPHASPPTTNSPVAELQAQGEVSIGSFPITLHPPLPTVAIPLSQSPEASQTGPKQDLFLTRPATQNSPPPTVPVSSLLNL